MPIALSAARYRAEGISLAGSEFVDTDLEGILVTELLRIYREHVGGGAAREGPAT